MRGALSSVDAYLFDVDGTLVDSTEAHARAFRTALSQVSEQAARDFVYALHKGKTTRQTLQDIGLFSEELVSAKQRAYREQLAAGGVGLFPSALELLEAVARSGRRSFLVTGASGQSTRELLSRLGVGPLVAGIVTADDVTHGKPHPEPFERALQRLKLEARHCVAIEDATSGLESAHAAGLRVVGVHGLEGADWTCATLDELFALLGLER